MPEKEIIEKARKDKREGKSPSTQAGEFVREEFHHVREGKHGARSPEQVIAIGLSKARKAGVRLKPPKKGSAKTGKSAQSAYRAGSKNGRKTSKVRSRATRRALKKEGHRSASRSAISKQAKRAARKRSAAARSRSAKKAARTRAARAS
ncbi:MAG TPA: transcription elongation factor [Acidobacteriota bacterium]|nr:transcription elongation factor [Acidobacteriota bacterium]